MISHLRLLSASSFALVLAACGAPAEEADDPTMGAEQVAGPDAAATPASAELAGEEAGTPEDPAATEDPAVTEEPAATPAAAAASPTPAASRPAAAATTAAAAATPPPMFAVCGACHAVVPNQHGLGPSLAGVFNSASASKPGFNYSDAMEASNLTWNEATLDRYLNDPRGVVPGTTMAYAGLKNEAQRQAVIDYLKTL